MCYIPDMTERFPQGMRDIEESHDYGYEPTYEELVADGEIIVTELNEEESKMKMSFNEFNKELENKGIVFEAGPTDEYETCCHLDGIYKWGFTVITYCSVLDPIITFYDWEYQSIVRLDMDENVTYKLFDTTLHVTENRIFSNDKKSYVINLEHGAPVHKSDIEAIGYVPDLNHFDDKRFYALKDGRIYFKKDGKDITLFEKGVAIEDLIADGYKIIEPEHYGSNIDNLNDMLVRM